MLSFIIGVAFSTFSCSTFNTSKSESYCQLSLLPIFVAIVSKISFSDFLCFQTETSFLLCIILLDQKMLLRQFGNASVPSILHQSCSQWRLALLLILSCDAMWSIKGAAQISAITRLLIFSRYWDRLRHVRSTWNRLREYLKNRLT